MIFYEARFTFMKKHKVYEIRLCDHSSLSMYHINEYTTICKSNFIVNGYIYFLVLAMMISTSITILLHTLYKFWLGIYPEGKSLCHRVY